MVRKWHWKFRDRLYGFVMRKLSGYFGRNKHKLEMRQGFLKPLLNLRRNDRTYKHFVPLVFGDPHMRLRVYKRLAWYDRHPLHH